MRHALSGDSFCLADGLRTPVGVFNNAPKSKTEAHKIPRERPAYPVKTIFKG